MRILLGIDDSPHSRAAVEFVQSTRWPAGSTVLVLSSVPLPAAVLTATSPLTGLEVGVWLRELTELHAQWVANAERQLRQAGWKTEARVLQGDPRQCLVEEAKKEHADLVVVGSHGRSGLDRILLGSVASHVVAHAPCSVLVIKSPRPAA